MAPGRGAAVDALAVLCCAEGGKAEGGTAEGQARRRELCGLHGIFALLGFLHSTSQSTFGLSQLLRWVARVHTGA